VKRWRNHETALRIVASRRCEGGDEKAHRVGQKMALASLVFLPTSGGVAMVRPNCLFFDDGGKVNFPFSKPSAKLGGVLAKIACLVELAAGGR
jgi:hypothetical protein